MKKPIILILFLSTFLASQAQQADTLKSHYVHAFTGGQLVAPAALVASGSIIGLTPSFHQNVDIPLRDWVIQDGHDRIRVDDYLQFAPIAAVPLLKACGVESQHSWRDLVSLSAGTFLLGTAIVQGLKYGIGQQRPYGDVYTSFPSGHTADAFMGAEILRREYGKEYPGIAIAGYAAATATGLLRIYNNRHWASDVLSGAGIGILSASITYWLAPYLTF